MPRIYEIHAKVYDNNSGQMVDSVIDFGSDSNALNTEMQSMIAAAQASSPPALPDGRIVDISSFVITSMPLEPPPQPEE